MTVMKLRSSEEWDCILTDFARRVGMPACLTDDKGNNPRCLLERYPLCAAIRANPVAATFICSQTNTAMMAVAGRTGRPLIDLCEAGLIRLVVPIMWAGRLAGQIFACGLASEEEELCSFLIARNLGIAEPEVLELAKSTPPGSIAELTAAADELFEMLNCRPPSP